MTIKRNSVLGCRESFALPPSVSYSDSSQVCSAVGPLGQFSPFPSGTTNLIKCDAADETNFYSSKQFNFCCLLRVIEILRPRVRAVEMEIHLTEKRPTSSQTYSFERPWNFTCSSLTLPCGHRTKDGGRFASALAPGLQSQLV